MMEKIPLTAEEEIIKNSSILESATIAEQYKNKNLQELKNMFSELENFFGYDVIEDAILFINTDEYLKNLPKKDLYKHSIYQIISGSSVVEGEKHWTDFSQEEIKNDIDIKRFVDIDKRIEQFIKNNYEELLKEKYNKLIIKFGLPLINKVLSFINEDIEGVSKEELKKHKLYHMVILSTPDPDKSKFTFLDFSQKEINADPYIKRFVEIDLLIKKFIEDEYEKMQKEQNR